MAIKQKKISRNQTKFNTHFKSYLYNIPIPLLATSFWRNTSMQIYISKKDQPADNNRNKMKNILLLATTIGSTYFMKGGAHLGNNLIVNDNQARY